MPYVLDRWNPSRHGSATNGKRMRLHETRNIDRPSPEVFDYVADFSNIESWDPGVASSEKVSDGPVGVGTKFDLVARFGASEIPMTYEVTRYEPGHRVTLVGRGGSLEAVDDIVFEPVGGGTLVDYTAAITFHGWVRFVAPLMSPMMKRVGGRALDGLVSVMQG